MTLAASNPDARVKEMLAEALASHCAGRLQEAERSYLAVLEVEARNADALTLLATLRAQQGAFESAIELLTSSLTIEHRQPFAYNSLGNVLNAVKRHAEAVAHYEQAIALKPDHAVAYNNRGNALRALNRYDEALASYARAVALNGNYAEALANRGDLLKELGRYEEAVTYCEKAIALGCDSAPCHFDKAVALQAMGRLPEAIASYDRALELDPGVAEAFNDRGNALAHVGRHDEALQSFDNAIRLNPQYAQAHNNRGNALRAIRRCAEAIACYDRALAIDPGNASAHSNRGHALQEIGRFDAAIASFDACIALKPAHTAAYRARSLALRELRRFDEALTSINKALELDREFPEALGIRMSIKTRICDWDGLNVARVEVINSIRRGLRAAVPFAMMAVESTPDIQRQCAEIHVRHGHPPRTLPECAEAREPRPDDRIRVAYLSADFHSHATAFLMAGAFEQHDRNRFELIGVSFGRSDGSAMRARLEGAFDQFIDVQRQSDREVALLLREKGVDIAVDLKGFTKDARTGILAYRPAPIQINYLGYPGTMGANYIDYLIADRIVLPQHEQSHYVEKIVYLPDTYQCNDSKRRVAESTPDRTDVGLPPQGFVFCSFNHSYKITLEMFDIWMRILRQTDDAVLWLLESNAVAARNLRREAEKRGITQDRLIFAPIVEPSKHLARQRLADLFLDTLPCGAHTTASDALWAGLPVLTCEGKTFAGRVAASLLGAVGLPEMVTRSLAEYESRALLLARERPALAQIRAKLARNRKTFPLFDTVRFTRHLEAAYAHMVERHRNRQPPASFAVEAIEGHADG